MIRYLIYKLRRIFIRLIIRNLVDWTKNESWEEGYTLIIGCVADLPGLLMANLKCISAQDKEGLKQIVVVSDGPFKGEFADMETRIAKAYPDLPIRVEYYTPWQRRIVRLLRWPWINAWLSWSIGIGLAKTRYGVLQDYDAMLLSKEFLRSRHEQIKTQGQQYLGVRWYNGNGLKPSDGVVTTFELFFDLKHVRESFKPIELFNQEKKTPAGIVDYDTFLYAQSLNGIKQVKECSLEEMVHPSQMLCQYGYFVTGNKRFKTEFNNLLIIPYFHYVGGDEKMIEEFSRKLRESKSGEIEFKGNMLKVNKIALVHIQWIEKQIRHMENTLCGRVREVVDAYLECIKAAHGINREKDGVKS